MTDLKTEIRHDAAYNEFLNITLKQAFDEHKQLLIDIDNIQMSAYKTCLWVNAFVVTGLCSVLSLADLRLSDLDGLRPIFGAGLCVASLWSIVNFLGAAFAYRGRPMKKVTKFYAQKVDLARNKGACAAKTIWITELDKILQSARKDNAVVMDTVHNWTRSTMAAAALGTVSTVLFFVDNLLSVG
ncbi:MAG: hypothetical protein Q4E62_04630 [Sutterellaceae bacterium]|nr:hypothetical protein [Sutterellaceae bacterium]